MDARWGWALAMLALGVGWWQGGWPGVVLAVTVVVFWLVLQFSRVLRVLRKAAVAPKGRVGSAVMVHAKLRKGLTLVQILPLTGSLGQAQEVQGHPPRAERFVWDDESGARLTLTLMGGRLAEWTLSRESVLDDDAVGVAPAPAQA
ncbi:hypothetical protein [Ideonella livida]|uniref:Glycerate kinase n=1 Tax=Ideonella livida TaxID=2707176 RepID=A0A7C9TLM3_9BURK|nr:hypothetical protein [Ideonella livida]NDY92722.1 hypothetical protein [Ideonella livida]